MKLGSQKPLEIEPVGLKEQMKAYSYSVLRIQQNYTGLKSQT